MLTPVFLVHINSFITDGYMNRSRRYNDCQFNAVDASLYSLASCYALPSSYSSGMSAGAGASGGLTSRSALYASDARSAEAQYAASFGQYVAAHGYALGHLGVGVGAGAGGGSGLGLPGGGGGGGGAGIGMMSSNSCSSGSGSSVGMSTSASLALKDLSDAAVTRHIGGASAAAPALRS